MYTIYCSVNDEFFFCYIINLSVLINTFSDVYLNRTKEETEAAHDLLQLANTLPPINNSTQPNNNTTMPNSNSEPSLQNSKPVININLPINHKIPSLQQTHLPKSNTIPPISLEPPPVHLTAPQLNHAFITVNPTPPQIMTTVPQIINASQQVINAIPQYNTASPQINQVVQPIQHQVIKLATINNNTIIPYHIPISSINSQELNPVPPSFNGSSDDQQTAANNFNCGKFYFQSPPPSPGDMPQTPTSYTTLIYITPQTKTEYRLPLTPPITEYDSNANAIPHQNIALQADILPPKSPSSITFDQNTPPTANTIKLPIADGRTKRRSSGLTGGPPSMAAAVVGGEIVDGGDRPKYSCTECGKDYATSSNLSRHKQVKNRHMDDGYGTKEKKFLQLFYKSQDQFLSGNKLHWYPKFMNT